MSAFYELIQMSVLSVLAVPLNPFFWIVMYLVYIQYRKRQIMEVQVLGGSRTSIGQSIKNSLVKGFLGGILGTIIMMLLGIVIDIGDFTFVFPLAILLMLINFRYICFAYAGGLLSLSNLLFGFPRINVSSILAIIAILHLMESLLIWTDGHKDPLPIFVKSKSGDIVGGFSLQRYWPIPFAILMTVTGPLVGAKDIDLPTWWPLLSSALDVDSISLQILAVVAVLGYGDLALTSTPKAKSYKSSTRLLLYSIILLILSLLSSKLVIFKYLAALFAPLGHELLIIKGQREEKEGTPFFTQPSMGIRILDIQKDSVAEKMKFERGDILLSINNKAVNSREDIDNILRDFPPYVWVVLKDIYGKSKTIEYKDYRNGINNFGILIVSQSSDVVFDTKYSMSFIKQLLVGISERYLKYKNNNKL